MADWENYRHFLSVAHSGTLSGAARQLKVDHATVSRRLAALEADLDVRLVDRLPRACRLTPVGRQVFNAVTAMAEGADTAARIARASHEPLVGTVTLSAPPVLVTHLLAPHLPRFRAAFPDIRLSLAAETRQVSLSRREADIAMGSARPSEATSVVRKIGVLTYSLYARRDYADLAAPDRWQFIAFDRSFDDMPQPKWLLGIIGDRPIACELNDINGHLIAAKAGVGVAALPRFLADEDPDLVRVGEDAPPYASDLWIAVHHDLRKTPSVRAAMDFVLQLVADEPELTS